MSKTNISRCMFCNSTSYGFGCPYSPHKKHVHISNGLNCIYCGSINVGMGCPQNPFSKMHIRGVEYNTMIKESVHQSVIISLLLSRFLQPITSMPAYQLGLINEKGYKIKDAITEEEKASFNSLDMYILKLRRLINDNALDLFKSNVLLEMNNNTDSKFDPKKYEQEIKFQSQIKHAINIFFELFSEGIETGISKDRIENLIIESILKKYEDSENNV